MGYVYFLKHKEIRPVKIGMTTSKDLMKRISTYKTYSPYGIELLGEIESVKPQELEKEIHEYFKEYRLKGEWFDIGASKVETIIRKYSDNMSAHERVSLDIPFDFNWQSYYLNELKVLRCLYHILPYNKGEFNFNKIRKYILKNSDVPEEEITEENMLASFNEYYLLLNGK